MIVIDASALLEILLRTAVAERLMARALDGAQTLHAPYLLDIEVTQVMRRLVQTKALAVARAEQGLEDFAALLIERHSDQALLPRIWQLRDFITADDGAYLALAEALDAPLLTCDGKLARAGGDRAAIELVAA